VASSRDKLIDDVHQAIWSLSQGSNAVPGKINFEKDATSRNLDELRLDLNAAKPYLDGFIEHLNHLLYLTSEAELQQAFREVLHGNSPQQEKVIELCLILALGANCIGNVAAHGQWYREARSRLYHFGEWIDDLRLMRILTFSCLYHLNFSLESSCHLLGTHPHELCTRDVVIYSTNYFRIGTADGSRMWLRFQRVSNIGSC
jgi:hypothetical protein